MEKIVFVGSNIHKVTNTPIYTQGLTLNSGSGPFVQNPWFSKIYRKRDIFFSNHNGMLFLCGLHVFTNSETFSIEPFSKP